ncbi:hypothetical protein RhiirB3_435815 [Rhizophagus irregularis]|nr:hypothetical protein RhiirB3_435815 [Rhizophagus irregularis]
MTEITDEEFESFLETFIPEPDSESDNKENNINFLNKNGHNVLPSSSNNYNNMQNKDFEWLNSQKENGIKEINEINVIFHVHLPENIEKHGYPVVLGNVKELGLWEKPIVQLHQPYPQHPTYWQSDPVTISVLNTSDIQYKYVIHVTRSLLQSGKNVFEGNDDQESRILNILRIDQFDIWKNINLSERYCIHHNNIDDFAFVDYIYNTIKENNLRNKVEEYQHLLTHYTELTVWALRLKFIVNRMEDKLKEKRLFLCLLLGYYVQRYGHYELSASFISERLLKALENYKQETLPLDIREKMNTGITTLVQHNAFHMKFDWLIIFTIAAEVDPNYTFIEHLKTLKYPNDLLAKFIKEVKIIIPYIKGIEFKNYVKIGNWLIQLCHNMDSLFKLWNDILLHYIAFDKSVSKCFIDRIRANISHGKSIANDSLGEEIIQSLELISQSHTLELLNIFPEILDNCFRNEFSEKIPKICITWFKNLLLKLNISKINKLSYESDFIFSVFQQLDRIYPLLNQRNNIWRDLTSIAIERVKKFSDAQIFAATKLIVQIKVNYVKHLFLEIVKEILNKTVRQINDWLLSKIFIICDCKGKTLVVPNSMSEDILYYIMTKLQIQSDMLEHFDILKDNKFWNIILHATGSVKKLNSNPFVKRAKISANKLGGLFPENTVDLYSLQQTLEYSDENLFQQFDVTVDKNESLDDVDDTSNDGINNLFEPKSSIYFISNSITIKDFKFPFSYYFMNQIDNYKNLYYKELDIIRYNNSENINYYSEFHEDFVEDFKNNLISINRNFENLQKYSELYYNDFIKIILSTFTTKKSISEEILNFVFKNLIGDKIINDLFLLHIYWWEYIDNILIQLKLIEKFPDIITKSQNDFIVYGNLDYYLFRRVINSILQNICDDKPWEQDTDDILFIINDTKKSLNFFNFDLLLICDDLLKINLIPIEKIKEIIYLGKSIKNQEFITTDIINLVFISLDKNYDIIHIRSFITRVLEFIPLNSEVRLILYKNLFSRDPFEFIDIIIKKVFITEYQQNRRIFFKLIKNSNKVLKLSKRLSIINDNIKNLDSDMAELCCEIIQSIFNEFKLNELSPYFKYSIKSFTDQDLSSQQMSVLQQLTSIAFLKEFISKYWKNYIQKDNYLSKSLIEEINNCMNINHSLIQFLHSYFVPNLYQKKFFNGDKRLQMIKKEFPWIKNIRAKNIPKIWQSIRIANFEDLCTFYYSNLTQNLEKYPFLSLYFKNYEKLELIKYLHPIVKFIKVLNFKLEYHLTRKAAQIMKFHEFIEKESENDEEKINLKLLFEEFAFAWNFIMDYFVQHQISIYNKSNNQVMNLEIPIIYGLIEQKGAGIHLCAILDFLIKLHNEFLDNVISIPFEKCKCLKFLENITWNTLESKTYFIKSIKMTQAQDINFINYHWNDKILKYSQKKLKIKEINFIFDLQKIEMKLAKKLVLNKVYFEMEEDQVYLKNFLFKNELFHNSFRILSDIKKLLPQEPIPIEKLSLISTIIQPQNSSSMSNISLNSLNSNNLNELLFLFEAIFYSIKELSVKNNKLIILDFVNRWLKSARYNVEFISILGEFSLKYIVELYELIEEQVADSTINNIDNKFKTPLIQQTKDLINNIIDYYPKSQQDIQLIPAKAFSLALKRFIYRFLLNDSIMKILNSNNLSIYFLDFTLDLWPSDVNEELIKKLFPTCLLVSHAYDTYNFIINEIEAIRKCDIIDVDQ